MARTMAPRHQPEPGWSFSLNLVLKRGPIGVKGCCEKQWVLADAALCCSCGIARLHPIDGGTMRTNNVMAIGHVRALSLTGK
jgi:hypothetical protein